MSLIIYMYLFGNNKIVMFFLFLKGTLIANVRNENVNTGTTTTINL